VNENSNVSAPFLRLFGDLLVAGRAFFIGSHDDGFPAYRADGSRRVLPLADGGLLAIAASY